MNNTDTDNNQWQSFSFDRLGDLFVEVGSFTSPSQLHGLLCGQLCAGLRPEPQGWLESAAKQMCCAEELPVSVREGLISLSDKTLQELADENLIFAPLLPESDTPLVQQAEAMGQWCAGFLSGFGQAGLTSAQLSDEVSGVLTDIAQIAQIQTDDIAEDEESERDLFEVGEYVRMVVLMLFQEYQPNAGTVQSLDDNDNGHPTIHSKHPVH